jgi:hypothetical protein
MKRYLRKLADSFVRRGTRRTINITEAGKYSTVSARVHIRYCKEGGFQVYVRKANWNRWQRVYSSVISRRAKRANDRRAKEVIKLSGSYGLSQDYDKHETNTEDY